MTIEFLMIQKQTEKLLNIIDKVVAYNENIERDVENVSENEFKKYQYIKINLMNCFQTIENRFI